MFVVSFCISDDSEKKAIDCSIKMLQEFGVEASIHIINQQSLIDDVLRVTKELIDKSAKVVIATSGEIVQLPALISSKINVPVIALPIKNDTLRGLDVLVTSANSSVPIASVAIDGGDNAALLAVEILAIHYPELSKRIKKYRYDMIEHVDKQNERLNIEMYNMG